MSDEKKGLFHSELTRLSADSPVQVHVKSDVMKSKYKDKPDYVILVIDGRERIYSTENQSCADWFRGTKGRTLLITATGREGDAQIDFVAEVEAGTEAAPEQEQQQEREQQQAPKGKAPPPKGKAAPPAAVAVAQGKSLAQRHEESMNKLATKVTEPATASPAAATGGKQAPEKKVEHYKNAANRKANLWLVAFKAALYVREQIITQRKLDLTEEQFKGCIASLFISLERDGFGSQIPLGIMDISEAKKEEAASE